MHRTSLPVFGLVTLVVLAGCSGFFGSPTSPASPIASHPSVSDSSLQELDNATAWIGGTVERTENNTVYVKQDSDVVIPVVFTNHSAPFYCQQATAMNDTSIDCVGKIEVSNIQDRIQGEEVCAFVEVENRTIQAGKVFFNAVCGGPQVPPQ